MLELINSYNNHVVIHFEINMTNLKTSIRCKNNIYQNVQFDK